MTDLLGQNKVFGSLVFANLQRVRKYLGAVY